MITSLRNVGVSSALGANEESDKERMEQHPNVVTALKVDGAVFLMSSSMRLAPGLCHAGGSLLDLRRRW